MTIIEVDRTLELPENIVQHIAASIQCYPDQHLHAVNNQRSLELGLIFGNWIIGQRAFSTVLKKFCYSLINRLSQSKFALTPMSSKKTCRIKDDRRRKRGCRANHVAALSQGSAF